MIIAVNTIFILIVCWWVSGFNSPYGKLWYWLALSLKVMAGIVLGLIYKYYLQSGDTLLYFREALEIVNFGEQSYLDYLNRIITNEIPPHKGEYRTEFFARILSFFIFITAGSYWLSAVYLSLISFLGSWSLSRTLGILDEKLKWPAFTGLMLIPSIVFWSSGILKDSFANACFFYLCTFLIRFYLKKPASLIEHVAYAITLIALIKIRFYLGGMILLLLGSLLVRNLIVKYIKISTLKYLIYLVVIAALMIGVSFMDYNLQLNHLPQSIYLNYQSIIDASAGINCIMFDLSPDWWGISKNFPKALLYGLLGPFPGQGSFTSLIYWIENGILLLLLVYTIYRMISHPPVMTNSMVLLAHTLVYILIMALVLPLVAPNFGTLMRYKSAYLPFLWMLLLYHPFEYFFRKKSA